MFTKYDFTCSFGPESVCPPKEKPNFRFLNLFFLLKL